MRYIVDPQEFTCLVSAFKQAQTQAHTALTSWPYTAKPSWQRKIAVWESASRGLLQKFPDMMTYGSSFLRSPPSEREQDDLWEQWHLQDDENGLEEWPGPRELHDNEMECGGFDEW